MWWMIGLGVVALLLSVAAITLLRRWREARKAKALLAAVYNPAYRRGHVEPDSPQDPWDAQRP